MTLDGLCLRDVGWLLSTWRCVASVYVTLGGFCLYELGSFCLRDVAWLISTSRVVYCDVLY